MEAKDTVMNDEEKIIAQQKYIEKCQKEFGIIRAFPLTGYMREDCLLSDQAGKSFPLGEKQGYEKGMKEATDFVEAHKISGSSVVMSAHFTKFCSFFTDEEWQAFLKEKGIV